MLAHDIQVVDLGGDNWDRLMATLTDFGDLLAPEGKGRTLLVVYRGLTCLKSIDLGEKREVRVPFRGVSRLDALAAETGYDLVIAVEETALRRILSRAGRTIDYRADYFAGWWKVVLAAAAEWRKTIFTWPEGPRRLPLPPFRFMELALRAYVPDDTMLLLAFTDRWRAHTSVALGYRDGNVRVLTSLDAIGDEDADLSGDGLGHAATELAKKFGGRPRAISIERDALRQILTSRFPLATALYAFNSREIALYRVPWRWRLATLLELLALPALRKR